MKKLLKFEEFINETVSVNEGAVKAFEVGMKNLINNIRAGYGWIDPEYVYDSVVNSSDFESMEWEDIKDEVYQRLIDNNLLYYANDADPEVKGQKVSNIKAIKESVNEAEQIKVGTFVRYKKDDDFTGGKIISINPGKAEIHNWDGSTIELPIKDLEYVKSAIIENRKVSIEHRSQIREYGIEVFSWKNVIPKYVSLVESVIK